MSLVYRILYLVGFTPWDTGTVPVELSELVEGSDAMPPGRALDVGCGTGTQSVYLARLGWDVTGIDAVERPLRRARDRSAAEGVPVTWLHADATRLDETGLAPGFDLVLDRGCFHGLSEQQRLSYAAGVTALAANGATLLLMAFARNTVRVGPAGADQPEITEALASWRLVSARRDRGRSPDGPLRDVPLFWYRLVRE
jgi:SAM-dependent methyltransferase